MRKANEFSILFIPIKLTISNDPSYDFRDLKNFYNIFHKN